MGRVVNTSFHKQTLSVFACGVHEQTNRWIDRKSFMHWFIRPFISRGERTFSQDWHASRQQINTVT